MRVIAVHCVCHTNFPPAVSRLPTCCHRRRRRHFGVRSKRNPKVPSDILLCMGSRCYVADHVRLHATVVPKYLYRHARPNTTHIGPTRKPTGDNTHTYTQKRSKTQTNLCSYRQNAQVLPAQSVRQRLACDVYHHADCPLITVKSVNKFNQFRARKLLHFVAFFRRGLKHICGECRRPAVRRKHFAQTLCEFCFQRHIFAYNVNLVTVIQDNRARNGSRTAAEPNLCCHVF